MSEVAAKIAVVIPILTIMIAKSKLIWETQRGNDLTPFEYCSPRTFLRRSIFGYRPKNAGVAHRARQRYTKRFTTKGKISYCFH